MDTKRRQRELKAINYAKKETKEGHEGLDSEVCKNGKGKETEGMEHISKDQG